MILDTYCYEFTKNPTFPLVSGEKGEKKTCVETLGSFTINVYQAPLIDDTFKYVEQIEITGSMCLLQTDQQIWF